MSDTTAQVKCDTHGLSHATFVCAHLVRGDGLGFIHGESEDPRPDAWCYDCDVHLLSTGGEWTDENEAHVGISLLCAGCYDTVRSRNDVPRPSLDVDGFRMGTRDEIKPPLPSYPDPDAVRQTPVGGLVKALFFILGRDESGAFVQGERMWVEVLYPAPDGLLGVLQSTPRTAGALHPGRHVFCRYEHIVALEDKPSSET